MLQDNYSAEPYKYTTFNLPNLFNQPPPDVVPSRLSYTPGDLITYSNTLSNRGNYLYSNIEPKNENSNDQTDYTKILFQATGERKSQSETTSAFLAQSNTSDKKSATDISHKSLRPISSSLVLDNPQKLDHIIERTSSVRGGLVSTTFIKDSFDQNKCDNFYKPYDTKYSFGMR